jgi:hypothetical protein
VSRTGAVVRTQGPRSAGIFREGRLSKRKRKRYGLIRAGSANWIILRCRVWRVAALPPADCWEVLDWMRDAISYEEIVKRRSLCDLPTPCTHLRICHAHVSKNARHGKVSRCRIAEPFFTPPDSDSTLNVCRTERKQPRHRSVQFQGKEKQWQPLTKK